MDDDFETWSVSHPCFLGPPPIYLLAIFLKITQKGVSKGSKHSYKPPSSIKKKKKKAREQELTDLPAVTLVRMWTEAWWQREDLL